MHAHLLDARTRTCVRSLPKLVPFKAGVSLDDLHEYSLKRNR